MVKYILFKLVISYSNQKNVKSGVSALSSTSSSFGTVVANGKFDTQSNGIDESLKLKALAEEEEAINKFKVNILLFWFCHFKLVIFNSLTSYSSFLFVIYCH